MGFSNKISLVFILLFFVTANAFSQEEKKDSYKLLANFDFRNSIFIGHSVKYGGIKLGMGNSKHRFGIGLHWLTKPLQVIHDKHVKRDATDTLAFKYSYFSLFYEPIFYKSKRWEFSIPVHINAGKLEGFYLDTLGKNKSIIESNTSSMTLSVKGYFKIWRWVGLQSGVGYTFLLNGDDKSRNAIDAPFYSFGIRLFLGEIWKLSTSKEYRNSEWIE